MCGISVIIRKNNSNVNLQEITRMNNLILHRGPDDEGYYFGKNFAFGHRRLSILDLSPEGHQPMTYMGKYTITYNGEVYNYFEIRDKLRGMGYSFKSSTDTEVILAAYDKWGQECVTHFNGMWSFAIYDKEKNIIFCSRDRFGIKPFYYAQVEDRFVFASEIKQLLVFFESRYVNLRVLIDYLLSNLSDHSPETFFKDIFTLPGAHNLIYNLESHTHHINKYYDINMNSDLFHLKEADAFQLYKNEFMRSIGFRLRSDVPVGTCLSGGLDSSSVAGVAAGQYQKDSKKRFKAIHARSSEIETDESAFASIVAKANNIELHTITPTPEEFKKVLPDVFYTQEEPFASPSIVMQYFVMKKAKELGCTVMLDGQGGDETLLGYVWYYPAYLLSLSLGQAVKAFSQSLMNSSLSIKELLGYCFYFPIYPVRRWRHQKRCSFLRPELLNDSMWLKKFAQSYLSLIRLQKIEICHTQLPHLLKYEDKNSMRHSVEARLPFLDYRLLEIALSISDKYKIKDGWTKYILRKAMEGILPDLIIWRKNKLGFASPEKTWIDSIKGEMIEVINESKIIKHISRKPIDLKTENRQMIWRLYSIAQWEKIYQVTIKSQ